MPVKRYNGTDWVTVAGDGGQGPAGNDGTAPLSTKGDLLTRTTSAVTNLGVGANDTVLTADSSTATGLKWTTPAGGTANFLLLNSGGTALTGSQTVTISGITSKKLYVYVTGASSVSNYGFFGFRFNTNTGSVYRTNGLEFQTGVAYPAIVNSAQDSARFARLATAATTCSGAILIEACDSTTGVKPYSVTGGGVEYGYATQGFFDSTSAITSVSVFCDTGNFDAGTVYVYGSSN